MHPMISSNAQDIKNMYPEEYEIIRPKVQEICTEKDIDLMFMPTPDEIEEMTDSVYSNINEEIQISQYGYGYRRNCGRRCLRNIIYSLLFEELFRRRRRPTPYYKYPRRPYGRGYIPY